MKHFKFELRGKRRIHKSPTQREAAACLHWLARADGPEAAFDAYVRDLKQARKVFQA